MSEYFAGVTFPWQPVTPSDDAIVRRATLKDGILYGCDISYSGYTLTMAAGYMIMCGRQFRHTAAQNWAVNGATSGYARLVLTIDTTRTSTKEAFDQVTDSIQYASSTSGFPELTTSDINQTGTKYQMVVAVVALGSGGISSIVSSVGSAEVAIPPLGFATNIDTYESLRQIGLSGAVSVATVCEKLPSNSFLQVENSLSGLSTYITDAPVNYCNIMFYKSGARVVAHASTTGTLNPGMYIGTWHPNSGWSGWSRLALAGENSETLTTGTGTRVDTYTDGEVFSCNWMKFGRMVTARFNISLNSAASGTWTDFQVASGLPKAAGIQWGSLTVDNSSIQSYCGVTTNGALFITARSASVKNQVVCGAIAYIAAD